MSNGLSLCTIHHRAFDDGATWQPTELRPGRGGGLAAELRYPSGGSGYVSLCASAWDDAGNRVEQEIVRAYAIR